MIFLQAVSFQMVNILIHNQIFHWWEAASHRRRHKRLCLSIVRGGTLVEEQSADDVRALVCLARARLALKVGERNPDFGSKSDRVLARSVGRCQLQGKCEHNLDDFGNPNVFCSVVNLIDLKAFSQSWLTFLVRRSVVKRGLTKERPRSTSMRSTQMTEFYRWVSGIREPKNNFLTS